MFILHLLVLTLYFSVSFQEGSPSCWFYFYPIKFVLFGLPSKFYCCIGLSPENFPMSLFSISAQSIPESSGRYPSLELASARRRRRCQLCLARFSQWLPGSSSCGVPGMLLRLYLVVFCFHRHQVCWCFNCRLTPTGQEPRACRAPRRPAWVQCPELLERFCVRRGDCLPQAGPWHTFTAGAGGGSFCCPWGCPAPCPETVLPRVSEMPFQPLRCTVPSWLSVFGPWMVWALPVTAHAWRGNI